MPPLNCFPPPMKVILDTKKVDLFCERGSSSCKLIIRKYDDGKYPSPSDVNISEPCEIAGRLGNTTVMWIGASNGYVPAEAFVAGKDGSTDLYVGRARYNNAFVPGKVHPAHGTCYIPWGGKEISLKNYEVLCGTNFEWTHSSGGNIPQRAIPASSGMDGEVMYIGRVHHNRTITVGKVHPSHGVCYIPYGGEELSFPNYEILLTSPACYPAFQQVNRNETWCMATNGNIPHDCFVGGHDYDSELCVGRAHHMGDLVPGKVNMLHRVCYIPWGGKEILVGSFEVLQGDHLEWICSQGGMIPEGAVHGGRTRVGEVLYIGRVHHNGTRTIGKVQTRLGVCSIPYHGQEMNFSNYEVLVKRNTSNNIIFESNNEKCVIPSVTWIESRNGPVPSMAFSGGQSNGFTFYIGRAQHGDELIPGKVHGSCFYSFNGTEHRKDEYQILRGRNLTWKSTSGNKIPNYAVHGGRTGNGEVLFIGRVNHQGRLTIGKVYPSHGVCYFPSGGMEIAQTNYEILISKP